MTPGAISARVLAGLVVGILVGLTGVAEAFCCSDLDLSAGVAPIVAVGSDAVVNCVTKIGAGWSTGDAATLIGDWLCRCFQGSVPGLMLGVFFLTQLHTRHGEGVNHFLKIAIAILLVVHPHHLIVCARILR